MNVNFIPVWNLKEAVIGNDHQLVQRRDVVGSGSGEGGMVRRLAR